MALIPPARSILSTCTTNHTRTTQVTLGNSAAKLRTITRRARAHLTKANARLRSPGVAASADTPSAEAEGR